MGVPIALKKQGLLYEFYPFLSFKHLSLTSAKAGYLMVGVTQEKSLMLRAKQTNPLLCTGKSTWGEK